VSTRERVVIVAPGDDPEQIQDSTHLERLRPYGEVIVHRDSPGTREEKIARVKDAVCLMNTRGALKWPAEDLRALPKLKMATVCGIGTDSFDLKAARDLGIVICNLPATARP
jgi:lactate dehydrogenase-like 2-hydroxyacid dehydrogenase